MKTSINNGIRLFYYRRLLHLTKNNFHFSYKNIILFDTKDICIFSLYCFVFVGERLVSAVHFTWTRNQIDNIFFSLNENRIPCTSIFTLSWFILRFLQLRNSYVTISQLRNDLWKTKYRPIPCSKLTGIKIWSQINLNKSALSR